MVSSASGESFCMPWLGASSDTCATWCNIPRRVCCGWRPGNLGCGVVPHPANKGGLTAGPRLRGGELLCVSRQRAAGRVHLRTCGRCENGGRHKSGVCRNPCLCRQFGHPLAKFLRVVLAAWHNGVPARTPSSFFSRWKSVTEL